jgi:hypothetical protein
MAKKQVLMKKMQAVRMGAGDQIMASHEPEGDMVEAKVDKDMIFGKSAARNERRFGKKGQFDPAGSGSRGQGTSERAQLAVKRTQEHQARRGVKTKGMKEEMMKPEIDTKPKSKKEKKEEDDPRSMPTKINLAKNKMRAMGLNMGYKHDQGLVDAYQKVYQNGEQQIDEILEKGARGKVEFHSGRSDKENRQVMKTKRKTVNNPKGRKIHQSPMGKTIGKLNQVKSKQYDAEKKGDIKTASKMMDRRKSLSGTLYDKTGKFYDRADND